MSTRILRNVQGKRFFALVLTIVSLFATTLAFGNQATISIGDPKKDGIKTVVVRCKSNTGQKRTIQWSTSILATDNEITKAQKIVAASPGLTGDKSIKVTYVAPNVVKIESKSGWTIISVWEKDRTREIEATNLYTTKSWGVFSVSETAAGGGDVTVKVIGKSIKVNTTNGQTAAAIEDAIKDGFVANDVNAQVASPAELAVLENQFPGVEGDGRVVLIKDIDSNGIEIDVNDSGLELDIGGLIDRTPSVPATSTWGLMVLAVVLLSAGGFVILRRRRMPATA